MNFLHLSFEDFFAYKLKFLSDIASPFNERLLALASRKLWRSRWSNRAGRSACPYSASRNVSFTRACIHRDLSITKVVSCVVNILLKKKKNNHVDKESATPINQTNQFYANNKNSRIRSICEQEKTVLFNLTNFFYSASLMT